MTHKRGQLGASTHIVKTRRRRGHQHDWSAWASAPGNGLLTRHCLKKTCTKVQYQQRPSRQGTNAGHPQDSLAHQDAAG